MMINDGCEPNAVGYE